MNEPRRPGTLVAGGAFRILSTLGHGSSGYTYEAERSDDARRVALKELSFAELRDWKVLELFEREARILAGLSHPQIPQFLGLFREESPGQVRLYIAQTLVAGQTLAALVESGHRFSEEETRVLGQRLLDVLVYLQSRTPPVFHRDLKPQNIVLDEQGAPSLIDFGGARDLYRTVAQGGTTVVGTFGYMAPEQFSGQASAATDLYGLGATLLFLLTRSDPGALPRKKLKVDLSGQPLSAGFRRWLERALEPAPEDRFADAQQARLALQDPSSLTRPSRARWAVRLSLGALLIAMLVQVGGRMGVRVPRPWRTRPVPEIVGQIAPAMVVGQHWSAVTTVAFSPDRRTLFTGSNDATTKQWSLEQGELKGDFSGNSGRVTAIAFDERGEKLVTAGGNTLKRWEGGSGRVLSSAGGAITSLAADPSLRRGVCGRLDGRVQLVNLEDGQVVRELSGARGRVFAVARSEAQGIALAAGEDGDIHVWRESTGAELATLHHGAPVNALALTADGLTLASAGDDDRILIWELRSGRSLVTLTGHDNEVWSLALSPDGDTLASGGRDARVMLWRIHSGQLQRSFAARGPVTALDFSDDGAWLAVGGTGQVAEIFRVSSVVSTLPIAQASAPPAPQRDADVEERKGWTPLHAAAFAGDLPAARAALAAGTPVDGRNQLRRTPLYNAAKAAHGEVATFLLDHGADPNAGDELNRTPLYVAVQAGSLPMVDLLIARGADPRVRTTFGRTLLHHAAERAEVDVVRRLLPTSDVNAQQSDGMTPLMHAAWRGHEGVLALLLDGPGIQVNQRRRDGTTALLLAADRGHTEVVRRLLRKGADPNVPGGDGFTARTAAERGNFAETAALLGSSGGR